MRWTLPPPDHPLWRLLQTLMILCGLVLVGSHEGAEYLTGEGTHTTEYVGVAWLLRELVGWRRV